MSYRVIGAIFTHSIEGELAVESGKKRVYLCEKISQARIVAAELGNPRSKDGFIQTDGGIVTHAIGHLLRSRMPEEYTEFKDKADALRLWNDWSILPVLPKPIQYTPIERTKSQFQIVRQLLSQASDVVVSTDPDREGEMIGYEILVACGWKGPIQRLWMLDTTPSSIRQALKALKPGIETEPFYHAALARSMSDWYVGVNLSRAVTMRFREGRGRPLSIGRVQTPTLAIIVRNHRKIQQFKPVTYYDIHATVTSEGHNFTLYYRPPEAQRLLDPAQAERLRALAQGTKGPLSVKTENKEEPPPALFDLNGLMQKANSVFGWASDKTLKIAQELYEAKLLSYPRTECTVLPELHAQHCQERTAQLMLLPDFGHLAPLLSAPLIRPTVYDDKKVQAHYAIVPTQQTVDINTLTPDQRALYMMVARSYLAAHMPNYRYQSTGIEMPAAGVVFKTIGRVPTFDGWRAAMQGLPKEDQEDDKPEDDTVGRLPPVRDGAMAHIDQAVIKQETTKPPAALTEKTLLARMKNIGNYPELVENPEARKRLSLTSGIGTAATRGQIIRTLKDREYIRVQGRKLIPTDTGVQLVTVLEAVVPSYCDAALTAVWEDVLEEIATGRRQGPEFVDRVMEKVVRDVATIRETSGYKVVGSEAQPKEPARSGRTKAGASSKPPSKTTASAPKPTQLQVRFEDKDKAKALGARWDGEKKTWVAPAGTDLAPFKSAGFL